MRRVIKVTSFIALVAAAVFAAGLAACDGDGGEPAKTPYAAGATTLTSEPTPTDVSELTPTPVPDTPTPPPDTPTPPPETGGKDGFRTFAQQILAALQARNVDFFLDAAQSYTITCPYEFEPGCQGQPAGTIVEGIRVGYWRSEGFLAAPDDLREELTTYLGSLSNPTLYAIGIYHGSTFFALAASSDDLAHTARVFNFEFLPQEESWEMVLVLNLGSPTGAEEWLSGECTDCYEYWERWQSTP